jgi:hypothetical protein|tara:strand:+ start:1998 stop:2639 length:642 start_codon:yes stop_codon:yes gene_type:complete
MKNNFKKNHYVLVKKAVSKELATFLYNYFLIKKQVYDITLKERYVSPFEKMLGEYERSAEEGGQVPGSYANYGDIAGDTLLLKTQKIVEENTGIQVYPNYSYARNYKRGDELVRHVDRISCEVSTTIFLGGDQWPIHLDPTKGRNKKGFKLNLKPGDMLIYRGDILEHWREPFEGDSCVQIFLHYANIKTKNARENLYDSRPYVGLPTWFNKK